jgi:hypothetical protein
MTVLSAIKPILLMVRRIASLLQMCADPCRRPDASVTSIHPTQGGHARGVDLTPKRSLALAAERP